MNTERNTETVGVVIGRFQTADLHAGHRHLIDEVAKRHEQVCVLIGTRQGQATARDPLDYETRQLLLETAYPRATVRPIEDHIHDSVWAERVDAIIAREFPGRGAMLYGSRDCCAKSYGGKHPFAVIDELPLYSGTRARRELADKPRDTADFRAGVIYGAAKRHPTSYQTVDVAILHTTEPKVLLAQKDGIEGWWFVGGFVDPADASLEAAAKREAIEETGGLEIDAFRYLGSTRINDARYRRQPDQIMTAFFTALYIFGRPEATDDVKLLAWHPLPELPKLLVSEHQALGKMLLEHLKIDPTN